MQPFVNICRVSICACVCVFVCVIGRGSSSLLQQTNIMAARGVVNPNRRILSGIV